MINLSAETFADRNFCGQKLLRTETFAEGNFCRQKLLRTETFVDRNFCGQKLLRFFADFRAFSAKVYVREISRGRATAKVHVVFEL